MNLPALRRWLPQFSLRQLLLATTFVAIACYALRWASPWWSIVLFYAGLVLIVGGILVAINRRGETRSFWAGFAICGILHMLLVFRPGLENGIPALHPGAFVTTWASAYTYQRIRPALTVQPIVVGEDEIVAIRGRYSDEMINARRGASATLRPYFKAGEDGRFYSLIDYRDFVLEEDFVQVAHGLWTLLLAYLGGHISLAIYRRRPAPEEAAADVADKRR